MGDDDFQAVEKKKYANAEDRKKDKYAGDAEFTIKGDPRFSDHGMARENRKCTDVLCLIIFAAFLVAMGYCTSYGFANGDLSRLTAPLDGNNNFCGEGKMKNYKYLYITNLLAGESGGNLPVAIFGTGICVSECPQKTTGAASKCLVGASGSLVAKTGTSCVPAGNGVTTSTPYDTTTIGQYCLPKNVGSGVQQRLEIVKNALMSGAAGKTIKAMISAKEAMLISFGMGFVYSLVFLYLMSAFAEPIAWLCVALIQIGLLGAAVGSFFASVELKKKGKEHGNSAAQTKTFNEESQGSLVLAVVIGALACCFFCCVVCGRQHLKLAIDVIDASADFTAENKRVILVPVVYFVISMIFLGIWVGAMACVASLNKIEAGHTDIVPQDKDIIWTSKTKYMGLFMLFGILWILAFIDYTSKFIVMAAAATYYFDSNKDKDGSADLSYAIKIAHLNHAGSIAFGSFIIAVVQFIELVFMYFAKKAEQAGGDNAAIKVIVCVGECVLKCIEKIVDYINQAAFCYIAVSGDNFCMGAWNGFLLNVKHCLKFTFANLIAKVFILLGKIAITVGNCFSFLFVLKTLKVTGINTTAPLVIVAGFSFFTASLFLGIFETAVMALMTCLAVDIDCNTEPKYGPKTFHDKTDAIDKAANDEKANAVGATEMA